MAVITIADFDERIEVALPEGGAADDSADDSAAVDGTAEAPSLLAVLTKAGRAPEAPCGGAGSCGKCLVDIREGADDEWRSVLACQTFVTGDLEVRLAEDQKASTMVLMEGVGDERVAMDPVASGYLCAFDIGTTTIACYLLDDAGNEVATGSMLNPQAPFGADVITRIQFALDGQLDELARVVREGMSGLIEQVCGEAGIEPSDIGAISFVGNPTMQQLFMGISPENLAGVPFHPVLTQSRVEDAADYLPACKNAKLLVIPDIDGYVGADTVACVVSTRIYDTDKLSIMVDIGTNGEIVLGNRDAMVSCSTAAGPALEGAKISCGMRGADGAINTVAWRNGKLEVTVIGGGEAIGICGSGLIDAVAVMLETGAINEHGRVQTAEDVPELADYLVEIDGERCFKLTDKLTITQTDIREVQLAKGAIAAGIRILADKRGVDLEDIEEVLLAGAFGSFLNPASACAIGLLPHELEGKTRAVGNAAGSGSKMFVCNKGQVALADELVDRIEFVELASLPEFQMTFAMDMSFMDYDD